MATPISEQSENLAVTDADANMEQPSVPSGSISMETDSEKLSGNDLKAAPAAEHETKPQEPAEPSAFHVVSYPDGHKELTTDILEACEPIPQPEAAIKSSDSVEAEPSDPGKGDDVPNEPAQVKHFCAKVVQQEARENADDALRNDLPKTSMTSSEEHPTLTQTESKAVEMEGVNLEAIDNAVERALLAGVGEDSCGRSVGDNSIELEGLQPKTADLNSGADPGQGEGSTDTHGTPQTHRIEKVYNIDEETRMGLDQTPVNDQPLLRESFTYPSLPPKKLFQIDDTCTKDSEASDTDTKMSISMTDTEDIRLRNTISIDDATNLSAASDSNIEAPTPTSSARKPFRATREGIGVSQDGLSLGGERVFTAENLFEYQWPIDGGEWHLLQEQVSEYLNVKSFKRKYPDLDRRVCDKEEKDFLRDKGVVTETQSDLDSAKAIKKTTTSHSESFRIMVSSF